MPRITNQEFINRVLVATEQGRIDWQVTAEPRMFTASFGGKWSLVLSQAFTGFTAQTGPEFKSTLAVKDSEGDNILSIDNEEDRRIDEIHELARRHALKIDEALTELLNEIDKPKK